MIAVITALVIRGGNGCRIYLCVCQHEFRNNESTEYVTCLEKVSKMDIFGGVFGVFGVCEVFRNRTKHRSIIPTFPPTFNAV